MKHTEVEAWDEEVPRDHHWNDKSLWEIRCSFRIDDLGDGTANSFDLTSTFLQL